MGFLRFSTKNTFVEVDVSNMDGSSKDARKIQSWGGPASSPMVLDNFSTDCSDEELLSEADDWDIENVDRLTTAFYEDDVEVPTPMQTSIDQPCESSRCDLSSADGSVARISPSLQPTNVLFLQYPFVMTPMLLAPQPNFIAESNLSLGNTTSAGTNGNTPTGEVARQTTETAENMNYGWTCRMIRNIPNDYTRQDFLDLLDAHSIAYNFVYLPMDWNKAANLGYAFVNLASHEEALRAAHALNGFTDWQVQSQKVCDVVWGKPNLQSLQRITDKFKNNAIMHSDVPDTFKPLLFKDGQRVPFPAPTVELQKPRGSK